MKRAKKFFVAIAASLACAGFCTAKDYTAEQIQEMRKNVAASAKQYIGCPYKSGAVGPNEFDCSGLVYAVMREAAGIQVSRSVKALYSKSRIIQTSQAEIGDLVFFKTTGNGSISHVGIYIGKNQFIHAASDGANTGVIVSSLKEKYYANCYAGVGQILPSTKNNSSTESEKTKDEEGKKKLKNPEPPKKVEPAKKAPQPVKKAPPPQPKKPTPVKPQPPKKEPPVKKAPPQPKKEAPKRPPAPKKPSPK